MKEALELILLIALGIAILTVLLLTGNALPALTALLRTVLL